MRRLEEIQARVAKLDPQQRKSLVLWLNWQDKRKARLEQGELGRAGEKSAQATWPRENWDDLRNAVKKPNGKKRKAR